MPAPIQESATNLDLSPRIVNSTTIVGSPADNTETIVASITCGGDIALIAGVVVFGWVAFTVGTSGTAVNLRIRRTDVNGSTRAATGAVNEGVTAATQLATRQIMAYDTGAVFPNQVYVATLTVTGGAAASTVSAVQLTAFLI